MREILTIRTKSILNVFFSLDELSGDAAPGRTEALGDFQINSNDVVLPQFIRLFSCFLCSSFGRSEPRLCSDCWPSRPVNLIQSLSFRSTRPRVNCNVEWRRLARALFSPASNFQAHFPNLNPPEKEPFIVSPKPYPLSGSLGVITPQTPENVCFCLLN